MVVVARDRSRNGEHAIYRRGPRGLDVVFMLGFRLFYAFMASVVWWWSEYEALGHVGRRGGCGKPRGRCATRGRRGDGEAMATHREIGKA